MDEDPQVSVIMATNPQLLLVGENPRLMNGKNSRKYGIT
jgi:hypothetical protein